MTHVGESVRGSRGFFGAREDRHDLFDARIDPTVSDIHGRLRAKELTHLGEPTGIAIGVVAGDEVANRLSGNDLPNLHKNPFIDVG